jgi:hypothetical protein
MARRIPRPFNAWRRGVSQSDGGRHLPRPSEAGSTKGMRHLLRADADPQARWDYPDERNAWQECRG